MRYPRNKLVYGVGINDADYRVAIIEKLPCGRQRQLFKCKYYSRWSEMLKRCYSKAYQDKKPTYKDANVCEDWLTFSKFKEWMEEQDWEGKCLDKDLLVKGNKVYSPETCVFVSSNINSFLTDSKAIRGSCPLGVTLRYGKYYARINNPFTKESEGLGYYSTPELAHEVWRKRKHELSCTYAEMETNPLIVEALLNRFKEGAPCK